jgi:hypothetical protein
LPLAKIFLTIIKMNLKEIPLSDLALNDERFRTAYFYNLDKLILSIQEAGLISPPLVVIRNKNIILLSGWKRILACKELSLKSIPVFLCEEKNDLDAFKVCLYENLAARSIPLIEKAEMLRKLKEFGENKKRLIDHFLPLFHVPSTFQYLEIYLAISRLDGETKKHIFEKNMPITSASLLSEFTSRDRKILMTLILPLGQNKQKEILEDILEISRKSNTPIETLLKSDETAAILQSGNLSPMQKADRLHSLFRKIRYPLLSANREKFLSSLKNIQWPKDISISPYPFFEENKMEVHFSFKNEKEFDMKVSKLQQLTKRKEFFDIFKSLSDE